MPDYVGVVFSVPMNQSYTYKVPETKNKAQFGCRVLAPLGRRNLTGWIVSLSQDPPQGNYTIKSIERVVDKEPLFDEDFLKLARWMSDFYMCSVGEALGSMLPGGRREIAAGSMGMGDEPVSSDNITLSEEQEKAVKGIIGHKSGIFYLYGITGSGKTEVFLQLARQNMEEGRGVIYLVPEIALTHQVVDSFFHRFPGKVAVLHSGLTPSQKLAEWRRIMSGEAPLVIGARSAVFAPLKKLGLIIIDEEHETSYKSGNNPRYHARQIAMKRCKTESARLVLGSATPSVESMHMVNSGRMECFRLTKRLSGGSPPQVKIIDMKEEANALSSLLIERMQRVLDEKRQTILFLNRRGFSYFFHCKSCGYQMKCKRCSVSLTYHKHDNRMKCHYCGYSERPINVCPDCGSLDVGYSGFGTEMIEEEVKKFFPQASIKRIDTDTIKKKGSLQKILEEFASGKIDILLGTQMVAKGLNFPGVKLVGIVMADTGLNMPDFRAEERTFSLIVQVAGRAGRYIPDGEVLVQTWNPKSIPIKMAAESQIEGFYKREEEMRNSLGFPPFTRIFRIVFRGKNEEKVIESARTFSKGITPFIPPGTEILGPAECPLGVISNNHRQHLIFAAKDFNKVHHGINHFYNLYKPGFGVYIEIDIDPVSLL